MTKVLVATEKPFAKAAVDGIKEIVEKAGFQFALLESYTEKSALLSAVADADALIIRSDKVDAEVLEAAKNAAKKSDVVFIVGGMGNVNGNTSEKALLGILKPEQECDDDCLKLLLANGAKTINNTFGDTQGIIAEKEDKLFVVVPENYEELEYMFETEIIKCLKEKNKGEFYSSMLKICGKSKEEEEERIKREQKQST